MSISRFPLPEVPAAERTGGGDDSLDRRWHLARNDPEIHLAELEYALYRVGAAFDRWQSECVSATVRKPLNSTENAILHVVRMKDRPKTIAEVARLLNRDDQPNLQYAIRKLTRAGLIKKSPHKGKGMTYQVTEAGRIATDEYASLRARQLIPLVQSVHDWEAMIETTRRMLDLMNGIYDSAALTVAAHRPHLEEDSG